MPPSGDVTKLLADASLGKTGADEALFALVFNELHSLARHYMLGERVGHTLQATALVNEAYVQLAGLTPPSWESRAHFMRVAARAMRRILIQHARRKGEAKRGGGWKRRTLEGLAEPVLDDAIDLVRLDSALTKLETIGERMAKVVELRYFAGLSVEDTARILGVSPITTMRDWKTAKGWLKTVMRGNDPTPLTPSSRTP